MRCACWVAGALGAWSAHASVRVDDARSAVALVLDRMETAVLSADQSAYMACVTTTDPVWRQEQTAWARDLSRHVPDQFELAIDDAPENDQPQAAEAGDEDAAVTDGADVPSGEHHVRLRMTWTTPGATSARTLRFTARFVREGDAWLYGGEVWHRITLPPDPARGFYGVTVCHADGLEAQARRIADGMARVRNRVDRLFGIVVAKPQEVKLYTSMRHLQASIYLSYTDGLGGWNEPGESIKLLAARGGGGGGGLSTVVSHEYGHVVTFEFGHAITDAPWWVLEGIAEVAAGAASGRTDRRDAGLLAAVERGGLAPFEGMSDFRNTQARWRGLVYSQGASMMDFIGRAHGNEARNHLLRLLAAKITLDEASRTALGEPFAEVDARWRFWITQRAMFRKADWALGEGASHSDPLGLVSPDAP